MISILRNIAAVVLGAIVGSVVNMSIINYSGKIIPPPLGADVKTLEGLKASIHLFEPKHFLFPFLAHALGTFVGALVGVLIAGKRRVAIALGIGLLFMIGGITNVILLPAPMWFNVTDILAAYIPMALLAVLLFRLISKNN